jgi:hypothetical protein
MVCTRENVGRAKANTGMSELGFQLNIDPTFYYNRFVHASGQRIQDMRVVLRALEKHAYQDLATAKPTEAIINLLMLPTVEIAGVIDRQTRACTAGILEDFVVLLDELIALKTVHEDGGILTEHLLEGEEQIRDYVEEYIQKEAMKIATNQYFQVPKKVAFFAVSEEVRQIVDGYNKLRIAIRHHNGIAKQSIMFTTLNLGMVISGRSVDSFPAVAKKGETISMKSELITKIFNAGQSVSISEEDVHFMALTLYELVGRAYVQAVQTEPQLV